MEGLIAFQQRFHGPRQQNRSDGVDRELLLQLPPIHLLEAFFRLKLGSMQSTAAVEQKPQTITTGLERTREVIQRCIIFEINLKVLIGRTLASTGQHCQLREALAELQGDGGADAACANHQGCARPGLIRNACGTHDSWATWSPSLR